MCNSEPLLLLISPTDRSSDGSLNTLPCKMPAAKLHLSFESYHIGENCCSRRWLRSVHVKFFSYHSDLTRSCPDLSCSYLNPLGESRNASSRCEGLLEEDKRLSKPMRKSEESSHILVLPNPVLPMFLSFGLAPLKASCWAAWVWLWRGNTCHWVMAVCKDYLKHDGRLTHTGRSHPRLSF